MAQEIKELYVYALSGYKLKQKENTINILAYDGGITWDKFVISEGKIMTWYCL